jgi:hypothetical protein
MLNTYKDYLERACQEPLAKGLLALPYLVEISAYISLTALLA